MKMIKRILIVVAVIIAVPLVVALFVKKDYSVRREVIINKPRQEVFNYVKYLKNQDYYSKWAMMDPNQKRDFRGTDGTVGFVYAWNSDKDAGEGEQEITKIVENERVDVEIRFKRPFETVGYAPMILEEPAADQTKVIWGMDGRSPYPMNFMNLFIGGMLSKDLDESLAMLKANIEKQ
jgi:uncharacterized protein YndB with AHSA1/START domain